MRVAVIRHLLVERGRRRSTPPDEKPGRGQEWVRPRQEIPMFRALLATALLAVLPVQAQEWPTRPVRMIVPFPPGGGTDTVARPLAAKLGQILGQQIVIDNRGGAGGTIGAAAAAKSPADG